MNPLKKLAGQTAIYGLSSIIGRLINYFLTPLYTRVFLPAQYGVITGMYANVTFLLVVFTYGMETAFFRFATKEGADRNKVYSNCLISLIISSVFFFTLFLLFSHQIADFLGFPEYSNYIIMFGAILSLDSITSIPFVKLRLENKAKKFAIIRLSNIFLNVSLNIFFIKVCPDLYKNGNTFIHAFYDPSIGVGYVFISNLIASVLTFIMLFPEIRKISLSFDKNIWKPVIMYALPLLPAGLAGMINENMDRIMLMKLIPNHQEALYQTGIYGANYKLSILMSLFIQTFRFAAEPFFFSESLNADAKKTYADVMKYFLLVCCLIFLGVMFYIDIVKHFISPAYYSGLKVVPILLLANLCLGIFTNLSIWYKLSGQTYFGVYLAGFGAVITLVLNFWWIPTIGYVGSAWATLICYASMMVVSYFIGQKYYPVDYNLKKLTAYFALMMILYFINVFIRLHTGNLYLILTFNTFMMLGFLLVVYVLEKKEHTSTLT